MITSYFPASNLSVLFQVMPGTGDTEQPVFKDDLKWSYLKNNKWEDFKTHEIGRDSTKALQASGISEFSIPQTATDTNTRMPSGLFWLRVAIKDNAKGVSRMHSLHTQVIPAGRQAFIDAQRC